MENVFEFHINCVHNIHYSDEVSDRDFKRMAFLTVTTQTNRKILLLL